MKHYICVGGCYGESDEAGNCESVACTNLGNPLQECDCTDSRYNGAFDTKVLIADKRVFDY